MCEVLIILLYIPFCLLLEGLEKVPNDSYLELITDGLGGLMRDRVCTAIQRVKSEHCFFDDKKDVRIAGLKLAWRYFHNKE